MMSVSVATGKDNGLAQRVRTHLDDGLKIPDITLQLVVMWRDVAGEEEEFAQGMRFLDALGKDVILAELVVPHAQAVTRLSCIHSIGTVRERETHILECACGR